MGCPVLLPAPPQLPMSSAALRGSQAGSCLRTTSLPYPYRFEGASGGALISCVGPSPGCVHSSNAEAPGSTWIPTAQPQVVLLGYRLLLQ